MLSDLRFALRSLAKSPGFTAVAVLTLALGIGLSASSFSMANTFLLRDLPYPHASELMRFRGTSRQSQALNLPVGTAYELRESLTSFSNVAHYSFDTLQLGEPGLPPEQAQAMIISENFLEVLGVQPELGRNFLLSDSVPEKAQVALLTHREWFRHYAADPTVIGRTVHINNTAVTIIGVLPALFDAPLVWGNIDFILPRTNSASLRTHFNWVWMQAVGRLKPGVSLSQAQSELSTLAARLALAHPKDLAGVGIRAVTLHDSNMDGISRNLLWLMTLLSLAMLLIACANLASLQVARAFGRSHEFAVRAALGGSRRQLAVPLLIESLVLALAGGALGILVALWSNDLIGRFLYVNAEAGFAITLDARVVAFAALASLLSGLAFGLAPSWLIARTSAVSALNQSSRGATSSRSHLRLKNTLIVIELALAVALVGVASAFGVGAKSFMQRQVGWDPDGLFNAFVALSNTQYPNEAKQRTFHTALLARLEKIPGVEHAALETNIPIYSLSNPKPLAIEGQAAVEAGHEPMTEIASVSPDYFAVLRIPLKQGALFSPTLTEKDPLVAVVNESFARQFWPGQSPIGRRVNVDNSGKWLQIIGVVGDVQMIVRLDTPVTRLQIYIPLVQAPTRYVGITLRTSLAPASLTAGVRDAVAAIDSTVVVNQPGTVRGISERNLANIDLVIINLGLSAGMGLLIAAVGLFGVISQLTHQRTRDIGVRMALGAQNSDIVRLILRQGLRLLLIGVILGIPGYFVLTRVLQRTMPEMPLPGLWLLAVNLAVLGTTMLFACWLPARRAAKVDPMIALRAE